MCVGRFRVKDAPMAPINGVLFGLLCSDLAHPRPRPKDDNDDFVIYVDNGFNNSSMQPSASNNILGTPLESFEMTSSTGEVTITIS